MLLGALKQYAGRLEPGERTPPGYERKPVRYVVDLSSDGRFLAIVDTSTAVKGREARGALMVVPTLTRSGTRAPAALLADTAEYALGAAREGRSLDKVRWQHEQFLDLVRDCATETGVPEVQAVVGFLEASDAPHLPLPEGFDTTASVTFRVDGVFPASLPAVQAYWGRRSGGGRQSGDMECLLCGQVRPAMRLMPISFKGVPGGQVSGSALISANADAFESYGLTQSLIAPLCEACAEETHKALDALRKGPRTHLRRDPLEYVFWTRAPVDFDPAALMDDPQPEQVRDLLRAAETGAASATALAPNRFYAISLAGSGGRVAVREWVDVMVEEARAHLARFFRLQAIADTRDPDRPRPFAAWALARSVTRGGADDKGPPAEVARTLYRLALAGGAAPTSVLFNVVRRLRAEQFAAPLGVVRARAALVKLVLLSQPDSPWKETDLVTLDRGERSPAYLCGRLLSVLDEIQENALGAVNATIVDRFYGAASTTPAAVLPYLVRNAQHHLARLRRDRRGAYVNLDRELQEILAGFANATRTAFPDVLSMRDQGLFVLGFYHQRAERFTRRGPSGAQEAPTAVAPSPIPA